MQNLLIILAVLFIALFVVIPLVQRFAKPSSPEQMQKYGKIFMILMGILIVASTIKMCAGG
ncbi:MAG: hypothetical protein OXE99_06015 [Cellvibrionales bacterium]|nr:hypothetical protein [Cellvibrionales bacterium]